MSQTEQNSAPLPSPTPAAIPQHLCTGRPNSRLIRRSLVTRRVLLGLLYFGAVSSFAGGCLGVFANGGAAPVGYLADTPFGSYLIPGLILGIIVGGTQLAGAVSLQTMRAQSLLWCAVGGFGMMVWIFVELRWPVKVNVSSHQWMNGTRVRGSKDAVLLA